MSIAALTRLVVACAFLCATPFVHAADIYDAAAANPARSAEDRQRDTMDRPAEMLRLAGIKPGMRVADVLGGGGYYSELISYVVGPTGHVIWQNNKAFDDYAQGWEKRLENKRLPNVGHQTTDLKDMQLGTGTLDAVLLIKVYHDLYGVNEDEQWPAVDVKSVLNQLKQALKPGGVVLVVDHAAKPGSGSTNASDLHRIDKAFARKDFESHGFKVVAESNALHQPKDGHDLPVFDEKVAGKTDQFALVFRKP